MFQFRKGHLEKPSHVVLQSSNHDCQRFPLSGKILQILTILGIRDLGKLATVRQKELSDAQNILLIRFVFLSDNRAKLEISKGLITTQTIPSEQRKANRLI
jgi:hypothetical protein